MNETSVSPFLNPETFDASCLKVIHEVRGSIVEGTQLSKASDVENEPTQSPKKISEYCKFYCVFDKKAISRQLYFSYTMVCLAYIKGPKDGKTDCSLVVEECKQEPISDWRSCFNPKEYHLIDTPGTYPIDCKFYQIMKQRHEQEQQKR